MPVAARGLVVAVRRLFNVNVRFVSTSGLPDVLAFDGIYVGRNTVYLNANSSQPLRFVASGEDHLTFVDFRLCSWTAMIREVEIRPEQED